MPEVPTVELDERGAESVSRLLQLVAECPFKLEHEPGDYIELLSEADPDGPLVLRRANGSPVCLTDRETYERLRNG